MIQSGQAQDVDSMLVVLSDFMANSAGGVYPMFAARSARFSPDRTR